MKAKSTFRLLLEAIRWVAMGVLCLGFACGALAQTAGTSTASETPAEEAEVWRSAAVNRAHEASNQLVQAEELVNSALELKEKEFLYELDRKANWNTAGETEVRAGDLFAAAAGNLERTATSWARVARALREFEADGVDAAVESAQEAVGAARKAAERAVAAYERAVEAFEPENAGQAKKRDQAAERVRESRERLALDR